MKNKTIEVCNINLILGELIILKSEDVPSKKIEKKVFFASSLIEYQIKLLKLKNIHLIMVGYNLLLIFDEAYQYF